MRKAKEETRIYVGDRVAHAVYGMLGTVTSIHLWQPSAVDAQTPDRAGPFACVLWDTAPGMPISERARSGTYQIQQLRHARVGDRRTA